MCVDTFFRALERDAYPDDSIEGIFGVKMGDEVGSIVYNAWVTLIKFVGAATHENMVAALVAGTLPRHFEMLVRANENRSGYTSALVSRGLFGSIPWDAQLLARIGGNQTTPPRPPAAASRRGPSTTASRGHGRVPRQLDMDETISAGHVDGDTLTGLPAMERMLEMTLDNMVGRTYVVRHLTSAAGLQLNGRRCRVTGRDPMDPELRVPPRLHCAFDATGLPPTKLKAMNLAEPGSFVDVPSRSSIPEATLLPLLRRALAEVRATERPGDCRADIAARADWLQAQLAAGHVPPMSACMDPMLTPEQLAGDKHIRSLLFSRPCCCGDGHVDFARYGEGLRGGGEHCSICLEPVAPGEEALGLPCSHVFHPQCAGPWVAAHNSCPTCKAALPRDLATGGAFVRGDAEEHLVLRLKEWVVSGMCERCQATFHERNPLISIPRPDGSVELIPQSQLM